MSKSDLKLEMKALRALADGSSRLRSHLLPQLREGHFSTATTAGLFKRMIKLNQTHGDIPNWSDLTHDPGVAKDTRNAMKSMIVKAFKTVERANSIVSTLERLRQVRALYQVGANLEEALEGGDSGAVDPLAIVEALQNDISKVGKNNIDTVVTRIGGDNPNAMKVARKILRQGGMVRLSTGIQAFDSVNVGFPKSGVALLAANTGGGKSTLLDVILEHMAKNGARIGKVPLEMDNEENITRDLARITRTSMTDLADPLKRLTKAKRREMERQYDEYNKSLTKRGGCIELIEPGFAATIENLLSYCDSLDYDVIAIDYIGLLDGVNGDNQWLALSNAMAYAKKWAGRPGKKTLIIFAAQIAGDDTLRQSKAMADHVTNFWRWRVDEEIRENQIVEVVQEKCRGGKVFRFPLYVDFEYMLLRDLTRKELEEWIALQRDAKPGKPGKKGDNDNWKSKSKAKRGKKPDLDDDDEEEVAEKIQPRKVKPRSKSLQY